MKDSETLLAAAPVPKAFFKLAVPAVAAQLINILYNLVDKMFIGHIPEVGKQALAGVGVTTPVILATIISQGVSACFVIRYLCTEKSTLRLRLRNIRFRGKLLWPCILLGTSPALMQLTENLVAISFNTSLQTYGGDMAVASMSILSSVMQFVMLLLPGLVQGAQPLLSYNLGAKNIPRVKKTFRLLLVCCVGG